MQIAFSSSSSNFAKNFTPKPLVRFSPEFYTMYIYISSTGANILNKICSLVFPQCRLQNFFLTRISRSCILLQISCNATLFQCFVLNLLLFLCRKQLIVKIYSFFHNVRFSFPSNFNLKMQTCPKSRKIV